MDMMAHGISCPACGGNIAPLSSASCTARHFLTLEEFWNDVRRYALVAEIQKQVNQGNSVDGKGAVVKLG